jgi:hypothetical protein
MSFAIEQGAVFEGRSRRAASDADLNKVIEGKGTGPAASLMRSAAE